MNKYDQLVRGNCVDEIAAVRTIEVDPDSSKHAARDSFDKWKHTGQVQGGEWDQLAESFFDRLLATALYERFEEGKEWTEIQWVKDAIDTVKAGESTWNGCRSVEDVRTRCETVDELFVDIRIDGFKFQSEIHDADVKSILLSGSFDRSQTDVAVSVTRSGEFLFVDGNHRLSIARILDLERIPVRVVVRHAQWQEIRDTIATADEPNEFPERYRRYPDRPDVEPQVSDGSESTQTYRAG